MEESQIKVNLSATNFVIGIVVGYLANYLEASETSNPPVLDLASTSAHRAGQNTLDWLKREETPLVPDFEIIRTPPYWSSPVWQQAADVVCARFGLLTRLNQYEYEVVLDPSVIDRYWQYLPGKQETWRAAAQFYTSWLAGHRQRLHS